MKQSSNDHYCIECGLPAVYVRSTQFAGDHPYCEDHAKLESDFMISDSYTYWYKVKKMAGYKSKKKAAEAKQEVWPKVTVGSHLTVTTHEDGRTELTWDDEALLRDVQDAIQAYETVNLVGSIALGGRPKTRTKK